MPLAAVDAAVQARLAANWTATPVLPGSGVSDPPDVNAFVVVQYPVVNATRPVLQRTFWEEGAIRLVLNVKSDIGVQYGLQLTDQLATLFRAVKFDGVETFVPQGPIINDANDDGNWFEMSVTVPYRFEYDG